MHTGLQRADLPWLLQLSQQVGYLCTCSRYLTQRRLQHNTPLSMPEAVHVQQHSTRGMPLSTTQHCLHTRKQAQQHCLQHPTPSPATVNL